ncbi:unnamed protein product [Leuciscus chuanchicus]
MISPGTDVLVSLTLGFDSPMCDLAVIMAALLEGFTGPKQNKSISVKQLQLCQGDCWCVWLCDVDVGMLQRWWLSDWVRGRFQEIKKVPRNPEEKNAVPVFVVTTRCRMMKGCLGLRFAGLANHHLAIFQQEHK